MEEGVSTKKRSIKYPNKQVRSDKQMLAFYTGYEKRLQDIVEKHQEKTNELIRKLENVQDLKHEYESLVKATTDEEEKQLMNKYLAKIISQGSQSETTHQERQQETVPQRPKIRFL